MDGTRISVFWPAEDFWFHGTIKSSADPKSKVKIHYHPIGEMSSSLEDLDEETQEWKILSREVLEEDRAFRAKKRKRVQSLRVGTRVSVLWGNEDCFFQGTIRKIKESSKSLDDGKPHYIEYDDGENQWTNLYFCKFRTISPKMADVQVGSQISFLVKDADSGKSVYEDATVIKIANDLNYPHLLQFDGTRKKTYFVNLNVEDFHFLLDASAPLPAATQPGDIPNKVKNAAQEETGASSLSKLKRKLSKPLSPRAVDKSLKITKSGVKSTEEGSKSSKKVFKQLKKRSKTGAKAPSASANKSSSNKFPKEFGGAPKKRQKRSLQEDSSSASPQQCRTKAPMYESFGEDPSKKRVFKIQQKSSDSILAAPESVKSSSLRQPQNAMGGTDNDATDTTTQAVKAEMAGVWPRVSSKIPRVLKKRKQEFLQDLQETDIGSSWKQARLEAKKTTKPQKCSLCKNLCLADSLQATECQHCFCHACVEKHFGNVTSADGSPPTKEYACPKCQTPITPLVVKTDESSGAQLKKTASPALAWSLVEQEAKGLLRENMLRVYKQVQRLAAKEHGSVATAAKAKSC